MNRYFVTARLKTGKKAELAARLKEGNLAQGARYQARLLEGLRSGRATLDDAYFTVEADEDEVDEVRDAVSNYFHVDRVVPEPDVPLHERDDLQAYDALPDWAGVDRD